MRIANLWGSRALRAFYSNCITTNRDWTLVEGLLKIFGTSRTAIASANKASQIKSHI